MSASLMGVYAVHNTVNGKVYIGSSVDCGRRFRELCVHASNLRLLADMRRHGKAAFRLWIVEWVAEAAELTAAEQRWLDHFRAVSPERLYNRHRLVHRPSPTRAGRRRRPSPDAAALGVDPGELLEAEPAPAPPQEAVA